MKKTDNIQETNSVLLVFYDIRGNRKTLTVTQSELKYAFLNGLPVDGYDVIGLTGICEDGFIILPDIRTKKISRPESGTSPVVYECRVMTNDGADVGKISGELLKKVRHEALMLGLCDKNNENSVELLFKNPEPAILNIAS